MAKTDIILTHHLPGLGGESDHVKVAAGYARNYLFPNGLAIPLTGANKRRLESLKQRRAQRDGHHAIEVPGERDGCGRRELAQRHAAATSAGRAAESHICYSYRIERRGRPGRGSSFAAPHFNK